MYRALFLVIFLPSVGLAESLTQLNFDSKAKQKEELEAKKSPGKVIVIESADPYNAIKEPLAKIVVKEPLPAGTKIVGERVQAFRIEDFVSKDAAPSASVEVAKKSKSELPAAKK